MSATCRAPGSIFRVHVDHTHPLRFGYTDEYFTIKTGSDLFSYLDSGWNVGSLQPNAHRSGFAGSEAKKMLEHTLSFGVQPYGSGRSEERRVGKECRDREWTVRGKDGDTVQRLKEDARYR